MTLKEIKKWRSIAEQYHLDKGTTTRIDWLIAKVERGQAVLDMVNEICTDESINMGQLKRLCETYKETL